MTQTTIQHTLKSEVYELILKVCHQIELPLHFNWKGPKTFTNNQRVALLILKHRWKLSFTKFVEFLHETKWPRWLGLKEIPGKSTLHDWAKLFSMAKIRLFLKSLIAKQKPKIMAMDGTGIDSWHRSRHYEWRIQAERTPYAKFDILIDVENMLIHDFVLNIRPRHDCISATKMIKRSNIENTLILADGAYDSEPLHRLISSYGSELYAPVRKSSRTNPKGWFRRKCVEKHPKYGKRNCVEGCFSVFKRRFGVLQAKKHYMKKREIGWKVITYNIEKKIKQGIAYWKMLINIYSGYHRNYTNTFR